MIQTKVGEKDKTNLIRIIEAITDIIEEEVEAIEVAIIEVVEAIIEVEIKKVDIKFIEELKEVVTIEAEAVIMMITIDHMSKEEIITKDMSKKNLKIQSMRILRLEDFR